MKRFEGSRTANTRIVRNFERTRQRKSFDRNNETDQVDNELVQKDEGEIVSGRNEESNDTSGTFARKNERSNGRTGCEESIGNGVELSLVDTVCKVTSVVVHGDVQGGDVQTVIAARKPPKV